MPFSISVAANWNQTAEPGAIAIERHALAADDVFRRGADAHQPDHVGRALRQRDREIGRSHCGDVERAREQRGARIGVADELHQLEIDAELLQLVAELDDRREMADLLIAEGDVDRRRQRLGLGPDRKRASRQQTGHCERTEPAACPHDRPPCRAQDGMPRRPLRSRAIAPRSR
jgi:hypothetical protein